MVVLPAPFEPSRAKTLPRCHGEVHAAQHLQLPVGLREARHADRRPGIRGRAHRVLPGFDIRWCDRCLSPSATTLSMHIAHLLARTLASEQLPGGCRPSWKVDPASRSSPYCAEPERAAIDPWTKCAGAEVLSLVVEGPSTLVAPWMCHRVHHQWHTEAELCHLTWSYCGAGDENRIRVLSLGRRERWSGRHSPGRHRTPDLQVLETMHMLGLRRTSADVPWSPAPWFWSSRFGSPSTASRDWNTGLRRTRSPTRSPSCCCFRWSVSARWRSSRVGSVGSWQSATSTGPRDHQYRSTSVRGEPRRAGRARRTTRRAEGARRHVRRDARSPRGGLRESTVLHRQRLTRTADSAHRDAHRNRGHARKGRPHAGSA